MASTSTNDLGGIVQLVICTGNEMSRNTRPVIAGLKRFCPSPPKDILATPIATRAPTSTIHQGAVAGRFIASRIPVTRAEEQLHSAGRFIRYLAISHSNPTQPTQLTTSTISWDQP